MLSRNCAGLTIQEILFLLLVIAGVVVLLYPVVNERLDEYQQEQVESDLQDLAAALEQYKLDNHFYPTSRQGLSALVEKPRSGPIPKNWNPEGYLTRGVVPLDPWGQPYFYESREAGRFYDLKTLGSDMSPGGTGLAADISISR